MNLTRFIRSLSRRPLNSVALDLSGGGARGAIHLGVLQAFDENKIKIEAISGTSIGAIIGALYCAGVSPLEIKDLFKSQMFASIFHLSWNKRGLLKMARLKKTFKIFIPVNDFKSLEIPFYCCVSNLDSGSCEIFDKGDLNKVVSASASIPILFEAVEINGQHYVDGGLFNNLPVEPLLNKYKNIVGVHVNNYKVSKARNIRAVAERVFNLISKQNIKPNIQKCDFMIEPFLDKPFRVLDFRETNALFEIGYQEGLKFIRQQKKQNYYQKL
jgi:NTE family protein